MLTNVRFSSSYPERGFEAQIKRFGQLKQELMKIWREQGGSNPIPHFGAMWLTNEIKVTVQTEAQRVAVYNQLAASPKIQKDKQTGQLSLDGIAVNVTLPTVGTPE